MENYIDNNIQMDVIRNILSQLLDLKLKPILQKLEDIENCMHEITNHHDTEIALDFGSSEKFQPDSEKREQQGENGKLENMSPNQKLERVSLQLFVNPGSENITLTSPSTMPDERGETIEKAPLLRQKSDDSGRKLARIPAPLRRHMSDDSDKRLARVPEHLSDPTEYMGMTWEEDEAAGSRDTVKDSDNTDQKTMEATIKDTNAVLDQVLQELRYLRDEDKKKKDEINNLKDEDKKKTEEINNLKAEVQKTKNQFEKNEDEIHHLKGQSTNSQAAVASAAFTAVMDVGHLHPDPGDVIPFNTVWMNLGQHYDDQTSVFTCAESGLYLFSVTLYSGAITSGNYNHMSGALMIDGEKVAEVFSQNQDPGYTQYHQSAVTAVVECPKGGSVWVECQENGGQIWGSDTDPVSVFTSFAITYNVHP